MGRRDVTDQDAISEKTYEDLYEELGREPTAVEMQKKQSGLTEDLWEQFNMGKGVEEQWD